MPLKTDVLYHDISSFSSSSCASKSRWYLAGHQRHFQPWFCYKKQVIYSNRKMGLPVATVPWKQSCFRRKSMEFPAVIVLPKVNGKLVEFAALTWLIKNCFLEGHWQESSCGLGCFFFLARNLFYFQRQLCHQNRAFLMGLCISSVISNGIEMVIVPPKAGDF